MKGSEQQDQTLSIRRCSPTTRTTVSLRSMQGRCRKCRAIRLLQGAPERVFESCFRSGKCLQLGFGWIGVIGGILALATLQTFKRQTSHIVTSDRAWMVPSMHPGPENPLIFRGTATTPVKAECRFKNKGNTPAYVLGVGIAIQVIAKDESLPDAPPPYDPRYVVEWEAGGIPIFPKAGFVRFVFKDTENPIGILNGTSELYVYGYVRYRDVFSMKEILQEKFAKRGSVSSTCPRTLNLEWQLIFVEGDPAYNRATEKTRRNQQNPG